MKVKILKVDNNKLVDALVREGIKTEMPSMQDGWRFSFNKHIKKVNSEAYVIVKEDTPETIEGCMIYEVLGNGVQYMAFVEVAPRNRLPDKTYDLVAGCLIAYACKLSIQRGQGFHKGYLTFDVQEESKKDGIKLMSMYSKNYKAVRIDETTMLISPENGELLIEEYLNRNT